MTTRHPAPPAADDGQRARPLVEAPAHAIGFPFVVFGRALGFAFAGTVLMVVSCSPLLAEGRGGAAFVGIFLCFWLVSSWMLAAEAFLRARRTRVAVDEGGVRCRIGTLRNYWPFALVGPAAVEGNAVIGRTLVLRDATERPFVRMPIFRREVLHDARVLLHAYEARRVAMGELAPAAAGVERMGRSLDEWRRALDALVKDDAEGAYRGRVVDVEGLVDTAVDVRQPADRRAGAVYAVLVGGPEEAKATVRRALGQASPPIVLRMAELAGEASLPGLEEARTYLDDEDRATAPTR